MRMPHFLQIFLSSVHALTNTYFVINRISSALMLKPLTVVAHYRPVSKGCGEKKNSRVVFWDSDSTLPGRGKLAFPFQESDVRVV